MADEEKSEILLQFTGRRRQRLDLFLQEKVASCSRSRLQVLIREGRVLVDGRQCKAAHLLAGGERVSLVLPPPTAPPSLEPQELPLTVIHEDRDLIVVDKEAGMVVHPAAGNWDGTLVNALLHHCRDLGGIGGELRPGIVHRLDRDTSGVLVIAKNESALEKLAVQFREHSITREYVALVYGRPRPPAGTFTSLLGRHPKNRKKMASLTRGGRRAVTHYRVLEDFAAATWVRIRLETGRTHQIRVHFSEAGHPLVGDQVYGKKGLERRYAGGEEYRFLRQFPRQALHAEVLGFVHPRSGDYLEFR
ncbi:MAG: RluA family pseudouridine synthase, partial [Deltaproteobacteria bacterium]|nr:RluA family pseudouridine synthase [Deltaproteobacteria bacterium]